MNIKFFVAFFFTNILFFSISKADCRDQISDSCIKLRIRESKYLMFSSLIRFKPVCQISLEEIESKLSWDVLAKCTDFEGSKFVHIKKSCHDSDNFFSLEKLSELTILKDSDCANILAQREKKYKDFKNIKFGMTIRELSNFGLSRVGFENSDYTVWRFHAEPDFLVTIKVTGEKCDGKLCLNNEIQKVDKILEVHDYSGIKN